VISRVPDRIGRGVGSRQRAGGPNGLGLIRTRRLDEAGLRIRFRLHPGDRPLARVGETVEAGEPIVERLRDAVLTRVAAGPDAGPADRFRTGVGAIEAELLHPIGDADWRAVAGTVRETVDAPVRATVAEIVPGSSLTLRTEALVIRGVTALGASTRGRLELVTAGAPGDVSRAIDVARAGTVLVVGPRIDAEILTRARAMGVRGIIVGGLGGKERRDLAASERRQRAGMHAAAAFGVLALDGAIRRPIAGPIRAVLEALAGRDVALVTDPPALLCDDPPDRLPAPAADHVRVRHGPLAGAEGTFEGLAGSRRFAAGIMADAGWVRLGDEPPVALPLADLERFD
jgi:hypothetical protein